MPKLSIRILLFFASYIPLPLLLFLNYLDLFSKENIIAVYTLNPYFWIFCILGMVFCLISMIIWLKSLHKTSGKSYKLENLSSIDDEVLSYYATYLIPLLSLDISKVPSIVMNLVLIAMIGIYFVRNNSLHFNIILLILGYHVFKTDEEQIIISKHTIFEINNNNLQAKQYNTSNIFFIQ